MKQKNMVLMAVAVGCGLVAAFLTSQLKGGGGSTGPEMVDVIVAKKELPVGTVLEEKDFNDILTKQPFARAAVPPDVINDPEALKGKRLSRTLRAGNYFAPSDISNNAGIALPEGCFMYAVRMDAVRAVAGFVMPGSRVEVLALQRHPTDTNKVRSRLIMSNMLVVAVDIHDRRPEGGGPAIPTITSVSLAVTPDQGKLLHNAESAGGELRLMLRGPQTEGSETAEVKVDDWYDFSDVAGGGSSAPRGPDTVQIAYVKKDVPLNTKITSDNLGEYFELKAHIAPGPSRGVRDLTDLKGKYVVVPLSAEVPVLHNSLGDNEVLVATPAVIQPERVVEKIVTKERIVEVKGKEDPNHDHTLTIINGTRTENIHYQGSTPKDLRKVDPSKVKPSQDSGARPIEFKNGGLPMPRPAVGSGSSI